MYPNLSICPKCFQRFLDVHFTVPGSDFALRTGKMLIEELVRGKKYLGRPYEEPQRRSRKKKLTPTGVRHEIEDD